jgi:hypothetical protein
MANPEGVIAVVGGSRGTGASLSRQLLEDGHLVVVGYAAKEKKARQVAGLIHPDKPREVLDPPEFDDRATVAQIDVTDPESRMRFAAEVMAFAEQHDTTINTLALLGAAGIGQTVRRTFAVNQEGQVMTARTFWEETDFSTDSHPLTLFAQSFQGHTAFHPDVNARAEFPDDYAPVAVSKWGGEVALRMLNNDLNENDNILSRHSLAVVVGDALVDSDPIMLLTRRANQAKYRLEAGEGREGDEEMVEQMEKLSGRDQELLEAGYNPVLTTAYAGVMRRIINEKSAPLGVYQSTYYIPEKLVINGKVVDLGITGTPLNWMHGQSTS